MVYGSDNFGVVTRQTMLDAVIAGPRYVRTAADEKANAIRCAVEDIERFRFQLEIGCKMLGKANKEAATGMFSNRKTSQAEAFRRINKARAALRRAEKALIAAEAS